MNQPAVYHVVLRRPESFDLEKLTDILMGVLSVSRMDIVLRLKHAWGMLHSTPELGEAEAIRAELTRNGFDTFILPAAEMKKSPPLKILKKAVPEPAGLAYQDGETSILLPWSSVILLGCGQVIETSQVKRRAVGDAKVARTLATTGLSLTSAVRISHHRIKGKTVTEKRTGTNFSIDLITDGGSDSVRIAGEAFNYAYLGERKGYNVLMNFRLLYMDIARYLPHILKNRGALAMESDAVMKSRYSDTEKYQNELLWLLQLIGREE